MIKRSSPLSRIAAATLLGWLAFNSPLPAAAADASRIVVKDFMFAPTTLTVSAGTTVTWTNMDDEPHTVISDAGLFRSSALDTQESFTYRFEKPGTYHYVCSIHPRMLGTIVVQ